MTRTSLLVGVSFLCCTAAATAQCTNPWLPSDGAPGATGFVHAATTWDPDGSGPAHELVVVGGAFQAVADVLAPGVAAWDPQTGQWSAIGAGLGGIVRGVAAAPNGDLFAVGSSWPASGGFVARWNGAAWSTLAVTTPSSHGDNVGAVACQPNGDVVIGGAFATVGGVAALNIARWNGATWSAMGPGSAGAVYAVEVLANGDVVASGGYPIPGGGSTSVARWSGSAWQPVGPGPQIGVYVLRALANGDLIAGGFSFWGSSFTGGLARWNGTVWSSMGGGVDDEVRSIAELPNGDVVVGGAFDTAGGVAARCVARWDGTAWWPLGSGAGSGINDSVHALAVASTGPLVAGGAFSIMGAKAALNLAVWNANTWSPVGPGVNRAVHVLKRLPDGDLIAGGEFTSIGTATASRIARRSGGTWAPLGSGTNGAVHDAITMPNGDLVVCGDFTTAGGVLARFVARWNGSSWAPLGTGPDYHCRALTLAANGDLIVGGNFQVAGGTPAKFVARWNGTTWSPLGGGTNHVVFALATLPGGDIVAGGLFSLAGGSAAAGIARWDGTAWHPLGQGLAGVVTGAPAVYTLAVAPDGALVVGGRFDQAGGVLANHVARWHNGAWSSFGTGVSGIGTAWPDVQALTFAPDGDVIAGGRFAPGGLARWNEGAWQPIAPGLAYPGGEARASSLAMMPEGTLEVGGSFLGAGGAASPFLARLGTTCPASVVSYGAGCASSAGPMVLTPVALPWRGSTFRGAATGLPASSFALALWGFSQLAVPLPAILPEGVAGCTLLASPDWADVLLPTAGEVETQLAIPNTLSLATVVNHQVAALELGPSGIVAVTASNGLALTFGRF